GPAALASSSATPGTAGGGFGDGATGSQAIAPPTSGPELPALAWLSIALVAVGLALFGIRAVARRLA
ncbi:MAG TPA: hypothetical protein VFP19_02420, partial [Candidatus Limnocylindrales bacterium]|nr:hypothetical protein [Candidatus Limnocylindrales bacterium]